MDKKLRGLILKAQSILADHLPPDGKSEKDTIASLLELLDGPESRDALSQQESGEKPVEEFNGWYCAQCECGVDASEVTFHEQHQACGRVITNDRPPRHTTQHSAPTELPKYDGYMDFYGEEGRVTSDKGWLESTVRAHGEACARAAQAVAAVSDLHNAIINIPCDRSLSKFPTREAFVHYKEGHRDARHAAAELAAAASSANPKGAEPSEQDKLDAERYRHIRGDASGDLFGSLYCNKAEFWDCLIDAAIQATAAQGKTL